MVPRKRGYRRRLSRAPKGSRPWTSGAYKEFNRRGHFLGFDVTPVCTCLAPVKRSTLMGQFPKNPIRVLSLFDGISTGLVVLQKLGLCVERYYSCELDEHALSVQTYHFHNKVTPLGSVTTLCPEDVEALGRIDLLIGGSPCQDFSLANPRRRGLHGPDTTGQLFFEFTRILKQLQINAKTHGHHLFWLFENTAAMEVEVREEMSRHLQCEPIKICSSSFVPMKRARNFWGNIPTMSRLTVLKKCKVTLQTFVRAPRRAAVPSVPTITTQSHSQLTGAERKYPVLDAEGRECLLHLTEVESLFGFAEHFTDVNNISVTARRMLLGNAWSVDVVEHILKPLRIFFQTWL